MSLGTTAHECRRRRPRRDLFSTQHRQRWDHGNGDARRLQLRREELQLPHPSASGSTGLVTEVARAEQNATQQLAQIDEIIGRSEALERGIDLRFLYDEERRIFAIGYQVGERRLDNSFYDLLASEARLTSLLAIARGDVPLEHGGRSGARLARPMDGFPSSPGPAPCLNTSCLFCSPRTHEDSLLDRACHDAVYCQIAYGENLGVPWGISESAFSAVDRNHVYQYRAFGVPALALKRGQRTRPGRRARMRRLLRSGLNRSQRPEICESSLSPATPPCWAITVTTSRSIFRGAARPGGAAGIAVRCYMVHHQGMSLLAFDNALHDGVMRRRFHSDPRIRATEPPAPRAYPSHYSSDNG